MNTYFKITLSLLLTYIPLTIAMEQTQQYMPPVYIRNILNDTDLTLELETQNKTIATIAPHGFKHIGLRLPVAKGVFFPITPWVNILHNQTTLLNWRFERVDTVNDGKKLYVYSGTVHWGTPERLRQITKKDTPYMPGQKDSYNIDITFDGEDLSETQFEIECTLFYSR